MPDPFISTIVKKVAPTLGAQVLVEPEYGFVGVITFKNGLRSYFRNRNFNINPQGASDIARDKTYAAFFLKQWGYNVPEGNSFFSDILNSKLRLKRTIDDGYIYAKKLGFPVIVKPNDSSQGILVAKVNNKAEYYRIARKIFKISHVMVVQRYYPGADYRIVVIDDEVISAYQRIPLFVIGNGRDSITKLMDKKAKAFEKGNRDGELDSKDFRIAMKLGQQGLDERYIPRKGQRIDLLDNANLSTGGDAVDVTHTIHRDFKTLCVDITRNMGLRLCGVDIITNDLTKPIAGQNYIVLEINSAPGLDNYAAIGKEQQKRVETLYKKVLLALEGTL